MTDDKFWEHINSVNAKLVLLAIIEYYDIASGNISKLYVSNTKYVTGATGSLQNVAFDPILDINTHSLTTTLNIPNPTDNRMGISTESVIDELIMINKGGVYDYLLNNIFDGHSISLYLGDKSFAFDDFRLIKKLVGSNLTCKGEFSLSLQFSSLDGAFNCEAQRNLITSGVSKGNPIPIAYGYVNRASPIYLGINSSTNRKRYKLNEWKIHSIVSINDNGTLLSPTVNYIGYLDVGEFEMVTEPFGTLTVNFYGTTDSSGACIVRSGDIINHLLKNKSSSGVTLDAASLAAFNVDNPHPVGIYITQRINMNELLDNILSSCLGFKYFGSSDTMYLGSFRLATSTSPVVLDHSYILNDSGGVNMDSTFIMPLANTKITYKKNYTPTDSSSTGLSDAIRQEIKLPYSVYNSGFIYDDPLKALSISGFNGNTGTLTLDVIDMSAKGVSDLRLKVSAGDYVSLSMTANSTNTKIFKISSVSVSSVVIESSSVMNENTAIILATFLKKNDLLSQFKNPIFADDRETFYTDMSSASYQASVLLGIYNKIRRIYSVKIENINIRLGILQHVKLKIDRYGMNSGVDAWIISCPDTTFSMESVTIKVLV